MYLTCNYSKMIYIFIFSPTDRVTTRVNLMENAINLSWPYCKASFLAYIAAEISRRDSSIRIFKIRVAVLLEYLNHSFFVSCYLSLYSYSSLFW